jgi:hypothetical protein
MVLRRAMRAAMVVGVESEHADMIRARQVLLPFQRQWYENHPFRQRWSPTTADISVLVPVVPHSSEWRSVVSKVSSGHNLDITRIERVQNITLWHAFTAFCAEQTEGGTLLTDGLFWHGCRRAESYSRFASTWALQIQYYVYFCVVQMQMAVVWWCN